MLVSLDYTQLQQVVSLDYTQLQRVMLNYKNFESLIQFCILRSLRWN